MEPKIQDSLIYKLDDIKGVQIDVLCKSLKAFGEEYQRFTNNQKTLLVKEVRKGSGVFEFFESVIVPVLAGMEATNTLYQFTEYIGGVRDVLLKKKSRLPGGEKLTSTTVKNVNLMFSPVINGNNNTINLQIGSQQEPIVTVRQDEYQNIRKESSQKLKELKSSNDNVLENQTYNKVLFRWIRTGFDSINVGNRGLIKQIYDKSIKVIFADDNSSAKTEMTTSSLGVDWQKVKYFVDVEAMVDDNRIVAYKILKNYPNDSIADIDTDIDNDVGLF